jgi:methyl-accepting chemotaxis protein
VFICDNVCFICVLKKKKNNTMKAFIKTNLIGICTLLLSFTTSGGLITMLTLGTAQQKAKVEVENLQVTAMSNTIEHLRAYSTTMNELAMEHLKARKEIEKELTDVLRENTQLKANLEKAFREIEKLRQDVEDLHKQIARIRKNPC